MSRPIKFRAWDKDSKRYGEVVEIEYNESREIDGIWVWYNIHERYEPIPGANVTVEQYTGLKDKNGKEIYEGDIVRTTDRVTVKDLIFPIGVVEFKQQAFWICNVPSGRPDFTHNETLLKYWETDLEVIGNIHENPELLEDK